MATVLVTGGTGTLGRRLVPTLVARGHSVRTLSRHGNPSAPAGVDGRRGDVLTGDGVDAAVDGADAVVHAVASWRRTRAVEIDGTRHVTQACAKHGAHLVYVSIVGVDRAGFSYYKAKRRAEELVEAGGAPWTIQRATQFHELIDRLFRLPVVPRTKRLAFQPVDTGDVSGRLADLVAAGPTGRAEDYGGPETLTMEELASTRERVTGKSTSFVRVPAVSFLRDFDRGRHLCPDHRSGTVTWEAWLSEGAAR